MKQKSKRKQIPDKRKHQIFLVVISILMLLSLRFPIHFLGDLYRYTRVLDILIALPVIAYAGWAISKKHIRGLAIALVAITLFSTVIRQNNFSQMPDSFDRCRQETLVIKDCQVEQSWTSYFYLSIQPLPFGIYLCKYYWQPFLLF